MKGNTEQGKKAGHTDQDGIPRKSNLQVKRELAAVTRIHQSAAKNIMGGRVCACHLCLEES